MKKSNYIGLLGIGVWVFILTAMLCFQILQKSTIGVIDTHALVAIEAQKLAPLYPSGQVPAQKLQQIAEQLKDTVEQFASNKGLILLAKGSVWGGELPDFTESLIERLKEETP